MAHLFPHICVYQPVYIRLSVYVSTQTSPSLYTDMGLEGWAGMARLQIVLKDETAQKLRDAIYRANSGWKKGDISNAVE